MNICKIVTCNRIIFDGRDSRKQSFQERTVIPRTGITAINVNKANLCCFPKKRRRRVIHEKVEYMSDCDMYIYKYILMVETSQKQQQSFQKTTTTHQTEAPIS